MIYFLLILLLIVALSAIFGKTTETIKKTKNRNDFEFKVTDSFIKKHEPRIEEEVKFWLNSKEDEVFIYLKGTGGGQGKIGTTKDYFLINNIKNDIDFTGFISNIENNKIYIKIK